MILMSIQLHFWKLLKFKTHEVTVMSDLKKN